MCTRFVHRGGSVLTGFNFDIDLAVWDHRLVLEPDRFGIGILRPDGLRHIYHGVHRNGSAGTLLYVHGSAAGAFREGGGCMTVADLTERFVQGRLSFDEALHIAATRPIVYAPDATMQAVLSDRQGRTLIVEPGRGWRLNLGAFSLMTNYSLLDPESTRPFVVPGDDRLERAGPMLRSFGGRLTVADAFAVLRAVRQEGPWATRVSFVYAADENAVYYAQDNDFAHIQKHRFAAP